MIYLKKFQTEDEYNAFPKSKAKSFVSLISESGAVKYDKGLPTGVFIQHIDGNLYTTDAWTMGGFTKDMANGVAVIDEVAAFVIAVQEFTKVSWASDSDNLIEGVYTTSESASAKEDYNGEANTNSMLAVDISGAAYQCANYEFPNGKKGYLPALGELLLARDHYDEVKSALTLLSGNYMTDRYWSSTQKDSNLAWIIQFTGGTSITYYGKALTYRARPFTTL